MHQADPSHRPKAFTLTLTSDDIADNGLRMQRIDAANLALLAQHGITDWRGQPFDPELLCRLGRWWVNDDQSVIFMGLGGGGFEVPEMHALVWRGATVHIECGGGGLDVVPQAFAARHLPPGTPGTLKLTLDPRPL